MMNIPFSLPDRTSGRRRASVPARTVAVAVPAVRVAGAGDDGAALDALRARVVARVRPGDIVEELLVADFVDLVWEAARLRRIRALQRESLAHTGVADILEPLVGFSDAQELAQGWARREADAVAAVDGHLAAAGLTPEHVAARTAALHLDEWEAIDRLSAAADARRAAALREIEHHRAALARRLCADADAGDAGEGDTGDIGAPPDSAFDDGEG